MEIKGMFACGLEYEGQRHRSFTLRLPPWRMWKRL